MTTSHKRLISLLGLAMFLFIAGTSQAQNPGHDQSLRGKLSQAIEVASQNQLQIISINETPLGTIYEVELNTGEILYSDISGDYLFAGDMYKTSNEGLFNLSMSKRQRRNLQKIAAVPEDEMIIFSPDETKVSIAVFTDVDCAYCRKLHGDLEELLGKGIELRYLAYPRGGKNAASFSKMLSVWCSDDRRKALTQAKNGQNLPERSCESPLLAHYKLGNELGITGTPAMVFPDGMLVPGYMDADKLVKMLNID